MLIKELIRLRLPLYLILKVSDTCRILQQVLDALSKSFVPNHLGCKAETRNEWLNHNSYIAKNIFNAADDQLILIADGTYCYCQKSANNAFQRNS